MGRDEGTGTHSRTRKYALSVFRSRVRYATGYRATASIVDPRASRHRKWGASAGDFNILQAKNLNPAECHTARMATTTSLARGTSTAALATRIRTRAVRRHRVAVRANAQKDAAYPGDSDDVDDEDLAYDATEMTYADLPSVPGGSTLDVSRAFTVDIDPSIVTNAMPNRGVLEYVRLPAN